MSAGEGRGEAPRLTTMRAFLTAIVEDVRAGTVAFDDRFGPDVAIVSDPALRQVIDNVLDNAAEVSPDWIGVTASRDGDMAVRAEGRRVGEECVSTCRYRGPALHEKTNKETSRTRR